MGNPGAKHVYMVAASYCDQYPKTDEARALAERGEAKCRPSLATLQAATEFGRTAFMEHWRYLTDHGFVGTRKGSKSKVVRTPPAAIRARASSGVVPESDTTGSAGIRHITTSTHIADPPAGVWKSSKISKNDKGGGTGTDRVWPPRGSAAPLRWRLRGRLPRLGWTT